MPRSEGTDEKERENLTLNSLNGEISFLRIGCRGTSHAILRRYRPSGSAESRARSDQRARARSDPTGKVRRKATSRAHKRRKSSLSLPEYAERWLRRRSKEEEEESRKRDRRTFGLRLSTRSERASTRPCRVHLHHPRSQREASHHSDSAHLRTSCLNR